MNYDVVIGLGCSFMNGDRIYDADGLFVGKDSVASLLLSKKLEADYVHLAISGCSNQRIFMNIYNWIEKNKKYKNPLFIIGLSGTARYMYYSEHIGDYSDLHPAQISCYNDVDLENQVNNKLTGRNDSLKNLRQWAKYYMKWIYNDNVEAKKLQREVMMLHYYLKGNKCDYRIHNSIEDSLDDIKDKINYLTFQDDDYKGEDTWNKFLMWQMSTIDNEDYKENKKYRSPFPPFGKRFCNSHPSPNANKELFERIYESLK